MSQENEKTTDKKSTYNKDSIKILEGIEAVRKRPAMYIGSTSSAGLHHLVYEIVDNSIDEALAGFCKNIEVRILEDNSIRVNDDGRGIPVEVHESGKSALEVVLTTLHAGGKFDNDSYKVSGGLHGVGVSVVNALSSEMKVFVHREGKIHCQEYEKGIPTTEVVPGDATDKTGTVVWFKPDEEIFDETVYVFDVLMKRLRELAFLNQGIRIKLVDDRESREEVFYSEEGIRSFVKHLNQNRTACHDNVIYLNREVDLDEQNKLSAEIAMQWHDGYNETVYSYANNIHTRDGGTHYSGFKSGLTRTLNSYAKKENLFKEKFVPSGDDWREGLTCVLSIKISEPQFEGQTKTKLGNKNVQGCVESMVHESLGSFLEENPQIARELIEKGVNAARVREAARKVRDIERNRKSPLHSGGLPGKLADCSSKDTETTELYIVEGDSAGGSAKSGRDRHFQAILPIKGKILNVEKARIDKILDHNEIKMIITALGTGIQQEFDVAKRRYGKLIIMTDADVDGSHIRTLLLTFFFRQMRALVEEGYVYIAQPPLYKFTKKRKEQYVYSDKEFQSALLDFGVEDTKLKIKDKELEGEDLRSLLDILVRLHNLILNLDRHNIDLENYWNNRKTDSFKLPKYRYTYKNESGYFFSDEDFNNFKEKYLEESGEEIDVVNFYRSTTSDDDALYMAEIYGSPEIEKICKLVEKSGLDPENFFKLDKQLPCELIFGEELESINTLQDLVEKVLAFGRKGLNVQRYKGLGEMNPDQLWTTTMDPTTRTLFQVTIDDAIEAERLFSVLMGSFVEPRRDFIEKYALEVQNLDV